MSSPALTLDGPRVASTPLTVAVVSPQEVVLAGLVVLLGRHPERVAVVANPATPDLDVVLYDVLALLDDSTPALEEVVASSGRVVGISRDLRPELVARALAAGISGYISIGVSECELLEAVEGVTVTTEAHAASHRPGGHVGLTDRETEVLTLIAQGFTNQEIARALFLSPNSIKTYVRTAYRKIGAASRSQAVSWALRNGFPTDRSL